MIGMRIKSALAGIALGATLLGSAAHAQTKISFRLDFSLYGAHAPFFLAKKKGYFKAAGLDVDIYEGSGSATVMQLLARNNDQVALIDYATLLYGAAQDLPITAVMRIVSNVNAVISRAEAP